MTADANIEFVKELFAAFRRGNFSDVVNAHAEDVVMEAPVSRTSTLPWAGLRRGRRGLVDYFETLAANVNPDAFRDVVFTASGDRVVVEGSNSGTAVATGTRYDHDWVMVFTIQNGEVQRVRHFYDPGDIPPLA
ncbi:MAG: nuclear transport factor 2 family protein [Actinomycetota bacterium]|nr:nuclear transport factor 2 family protein [Actinomycetota bacterium]